MLDAEDGAAAAAHETSFSLSVINAVQFLEVAAFTMQSAIRRDGRAASVYRLGEHLRQIFRKKYELGLHERIHFAARIYTREV